MCKRLNCNNLFKHILHSQLGGNLSTNANRVSLMLWKQRCSMNTQSCIIKYEWNVWMFSPALLHEASLFTHSLAPAELKPHPAEITLPLAHTSTVFPVWRPNLHSEFEFVLFVQLRWLKVKQVTHAGGTVELEALPSSHQSGGWLMN